MTAPPPRFIALDSLRGVAALGVAAFHLKGGGLLFDNMFIDRAWLLVDFFFVLSGFVIAANYAQRLSTGFPVARFLTLRLGRVYPLHLFVLGLYLINELVLWYAGVRSGPRQPFVDGRTPEQLVLAVLLLHAFSSQVLVGWSATSWSISIEIWLYAVMAIAWRVFGRGAWIGAMTLAGGAALLFASGYKGLSGPLTYLALRGMIGFPVGIVLWQVWSRRGAGVPRLATLQEAGALAAAAAVVCIPFPTTFLYPLVAMVFAGVVLVFAHQAGAISRALGHRWFVMLGTLSYSIYLIHPMVFGRCLILLEKIGLASIGANEIMVLRQITAPAGWNSLIGVGMLLCSVGAAWLTWRFIEMPAREWSRRKAAALGDGE